MYSNKDVVNLKKDILAKDGKKGNVEP